MYKLNLYGLHEHDILRISHRMRQLFEVVRIAGTKDSCADHGTE